MLLSACLVVGETVLVPDFVQVCTGNLSLKVVLIMGLEVSTLCAVSFFPFLFFPLRSGFNFGVVTSASSSPTLPSLAPSQG